MWNPPDDQFAEWLLFAAVQDGKTALEFAKDDGRVEVCSFCCRLRISQLEAKARGWCKAGGRRLQRQRSQAKERLDRYKYVLFPQELRSTRHFQAADAAGSWLRRHRGDPGAVREGRGCFQQHSSQDPGLGAYITRSASMHQDTARARLRSALKAKQTQTHHTGRH